MKNLNWWLMKIYRLSAFVLLIALILYILSGYGMTKGLIDQQNARWLHLNLLPVILVIAFTCHVGLAMRITFIRWQLWNKFTAVFLILVFAAFLAGFGYIELYYQQLTYNEDANEADDDNVAVTPATPAVKIFTVQELAKYNGLNGQPAYAAVDGVVYDLSPVFQNGIHANLYTAGQELTDAFYSKHMKEILNKFPVVGTLVK